MSKTVKDGGGETIDPIKRIVTEVDTETKEAARQRVAREQTLDRMVMVAQDVLAPNQAGMNVRIHLSTGLVREAIQAAMREYRAPRTGLLDEVLRKLQTLLKQAIQGGLDIEQLIYLIRQDRTPEEER